MSFGRRCLFFGAILWLCNGCSYFRQMVGWVAEKPQIKISQVEVQSFSLQRIELVFVLDVINPNAFRIDIEGLEYRVTGLEMALGQGERAEPLSLESKEQSSIRLPFVIDPGVSLILMKKYLKNPKDLKLKLRASMHLSTAFGGMDMNFEEEKIMVKGFKNP